MLEREKKRGKGRKRGKKRWREGRRDQTKAELLFQHTVRRTLYIHNSDFCTIFVCGIYEYMCVCTQRPAVSLSCPGPYVLRQSLLLNVKLRNVTN